MECPGLVGMSLDMKANLNQAYAPRGNGNHLRPEDVLKRWRREQQAAEGASSGSSPAVEVQRCNFCHADTHRCVRTPLPPALHRAPALTHATSSCELWRAKRGAVG